MKDELERLQLMAAQMPKDRLAGISQTESSGNPNAIGDIGAKAGSSTGLNQIQSQTARDLYKKGLLPKEWNGQKVKKNNLKKFLLDPDFNNLAAGVLYSDNKRILRKKAADKMIFTTEEQLDDWATKAHNQGVTKTLQRELYGNEPVNPKVDAYLKKVKGQSFAPKFEDGGIHGGFDFSQAGSTLTPEEAQRMMTQRMMAQQPRESGDFSPESEGQDFSYLQRQMLENKLDQEAQAAGQPQAFYDGGVAHDEFQLDPNQFSFDPEFQQPDPLLGPTVDEQLGQMNLPEAPIEAPIEAPVQPEAQQIDLIAQYQAALEEDRKNKESTEVGNAGLSIANQLAKYNAMALQGKIAQKTGRRAPKIAPVNFGKMEAGTSKAGELLKKATLMKTLAGLKGGNKNKLALTKFDYKKEQDKLNKEIKSEEKIYKRGQDAYKREQDKIDQEFKERKLASSGKGSYSKEQLDAAYAIYEDTYGEAPIPGTSKVAILDSFNTILKKKSTNEQKTRVNQSETRIGIANEKLSLSRNREARQEAEQERNYDFKVEKYKREISKLSEKQADKYTGIVAEQKYYDRIGKLFNAVSTGKKEYYQEIIKDWIPQANHDEAFVKLQTLSGEQLFSYIKNISGAQFSDAERQRFEQILPNVGDNPKKFRAKLSEWGVTLQQKRDVFDQGLKAQKLNVPGLWGNRSDRTSIQVRRKSDGKIIRMDKNKAKAYLKDSKFEVVK